MKHNNQLEAVLVNKNKVLVIGPNGAGKSTFAAKIGEKYGFEVCHLDKIFWQENWNHITEAEFEKKVNEV
ncbi:FlaR, partial [Listeria innocua FSL S4-378]